MEKSDPDHVLGPDWGHFAGAKLHQKITSTFLVRDQEVEVTTYIFVNKKGQKLEIGGLWYDLTTKKAYTRRLYNDGILLMPLGIFTLDEFRQQVKRKEV